MHAEPSDERYSSDVLIIGRGIALSAVTASATVLGAAFLFYPSLNVCMAGVITGAIGSICILFFVRRGFTWVTVSENVMTIEKSGSDRITLSRSEYVFSSRVRRRSYGIFTLWMDWYLVARGTDHTRVFLLSGFSQKKFERLMAGLCRRDGFSEVELPATDMILVLPKEKMLRECRNTSLIFVALFVLAVGGVNFLSWFFYRTYLHPQQPL